MDLRGAVGVVVLGVAGPTGGQTHSRGTAGTGCCSRTALLGSPLLSFDHCTGLAQVRSTGKTGSDCGKANFDLRTWLAALLEGAVPAQSKGTSAPHLRTDSWAQLHGVVGRPQVHQVDNQG